MRPSQARFVTACQQLLALGVVLAVLTPAAGIISIDVVGEAPGAAPRDPAGGAAFAAYTREAARPSVLPGEAVDAKVREYPLTAAAGPRGRSARSRRPDHRDARGHHGGDQQPRAGRGVRRGRRDLGPRAAARRRVPGLRGADPHRRGLVAVDDPALRRRPRPRPLERGGSARAARHRRAARRQGRPGPGALGEHRGRAAGRHDDVGDRPGPARRRRRPSGPPSRPPASPRARPRRLRGNRSHRRARPAGHHLHPQAGDLLPQAVGGQRAHAGPGLAPLLRGPRRVRPPHGERQRLHPGGGARDPAQHLRVPHAVPRAGATSATTTSSTSSAGSGKAVPAGSTVPWSAPTRSATTTGPSPCRRSATTRPWGRGDAMLQAYGSLFAWKLSLHGVDASSDRQWVGTRNFRAINGHRDAGQTACPGRYLYAKLPVIRQLRRQGAARMVRSRAQVRPRRHRPPRPGRAAIERRARPSSSRPGACSAWSDRSPRPGVWAGADTVVGSPDLTGDGLGDLVVRSTNGNAAVRPGSTTGFGDPDRVHRGLRRRAT